MTNSNNKQKKFKIYINNNKMIFDDITAKIPNEKEENNLADKFKVIFKKGIVDDNIIYEISNLCNEWDFDRYMKNIINRINRAKNKFKINFRKLKKIYIMKWNKNQIQFIAQNAMVDFIYSNNFYTLIGNNMIYVKNKNNTFNKSKYRNYKNNNYKKFKKINNNNKYFNKKMDSTNVMNYLRKIINDNLKQTSNNRNTKYNTTSWKNNKNKNKRNGTKYYKKYKKFKKNKYNSIKNSNNNNKTYINKKQNF